MRSSVPLALHFLCRSHGASPCTTVSPWAVHIPSLHSPALPPNPSPLPPAQYQHMTQAPRRNLLLLTCTWVAVTDGPALAASPSTQVTNEKHEKTIFLPPATYPNVAHAPFAMPPLKHEGTPEVKDMDHNRQFQCLFELPTPRTAQAATWVHLIGWGVGACCTIGCGCSCCSVAAVPVGKGLRGASVAA